MVLVPGRRGTRKAPSVPAGFTPEQQAFFEQVLALAKRRIYWVGDWLANALAASQTNALMQFQATAASFQPSGWYAPRDGWIRDLWIAIDAARTAGTLTVAPFKNGVQLGTITAVIDGTNTTYKLTQADSHVLPFNAGDKLDLRITTTSSWLPVTANAIAGIEVEI
jgi:hypothetical protein